MNIWKFPLEVTDIQHVLMPEAAKLLTVQVQNGVPCLWAIVHPEMPEMRRRIWIVGTGHEHDSFPGEYVATFQQHGGALVFHVFDLGEYSEVQS